MGLSFEMLKIIFVILILSWIGLMVFFVYRMYRKYHINYGWSDNDWKLYYPEMYCEKEELEDFQNRKKMMMESHIAKTGDMELKTFNSTEPQDNPYASDSFGLPPGTIRGIIAVTSLYIVILIEMLNMFAPENLEIRYSEFMTVFQMVIAFYFGSRAVDILKSKEETKRSKNNHNTASSDEQSEKKNSEDISLGVPPQKIEHVTSNEQPVLASRDQEQRKENLEIPKIETKKTDKKDMKKDIKEFALEERILALTASFETGTLFPDCFGGITGNFDQMGLSCGALQWNIGKASIQPLFKEAIEKDLEKSKKIFSDKFDEFSKMLTMDQKGQMEWALSIQTNKVVSGKSRWYIMEDWKKTLQEFLMSDEMISSQVKAANKRMQVARQNVSHFQCNSERALALMFDINVQNGKVGVNGAAEKIFDDFQKIDTNLSDEQKEISRMVIISNRRADVASAQWQNDVRTRKLCLANGSGTVHGKWYDLEKDFNITLKALI